MIVQQGIIFNIIKYINEIIINQLSELVLKLKKLTQKECILFAYLYPSPNEIPDTKGWEIYSPETEYSRQGIGSVGDGNLLRLSYINKDYTFCKTYPNVIVVPSNISDEQLQDIATFRVNARIPAITYFHVIYYYFKLNIFK